MLIHLRTSAANQTQLLSQPSLSSLHRPVYQDGHDREEPGAGGGCPLYRKGKRTRTGRALQRCFGHHHEAGTVQGGVWREENCVGDAPIRLLTTRLMLLLLLYTTAKINNYYCCRSINL